MKLHEFTIILDRVPDDEGLDALFEAGLDDCQPEIGPSGAVLHVMRRADSLAAAIVTTVDDVERAGFQATGIASQDMTTLADIAERTGRSRESVRLLALGKRGPGGFPAPAGTVGSHAFYSWAGVRAWFHRAYGTQATAPADHDLDTLAAADLLLRARLLTEDMAALAPLVAA